MTGRDCYRLRQGDYPIVYSIDDRGKTVVVEKIGHREDVYKDSIHEV